MNKFNENLDAHMFVVRRRRRRGRVSIIQNNINNNFDSPSTGKPADFKTLPQRFLFICFFGGGRIHHIGKLSRAIIVS
jgi:hypothetical protein